MPLPIPRLSVLRDVIWPPNAVRPVKIYAVVDCARRSQVYDLVQSCYREKGCLLAGVLQPELERAAPHLLHLERSDSVSDRIFKEGWLDAWGILIQTDGSFLELRRHLRTLLRVRNQAGQFMVFRFYDPRVLEAYLPTCTAAELRLLFGQAVRRIVLPAVGDSGFLIYSLDGDHLRTERIPWPSPGPEASGKG